MKKLQLIFALIILIGIISCSKEPLKCCSCLEAEGRSDKYIFPIQPGMEEWKALNSHQAMVDVCQIPEDTLKNMCTIGLVDTYFDYPILFTIFAFNDINVGVQQTADEFNGFGALLNRDDCATKFLSRYEELDPSSYEDSWSPLEIGNLSLKLRLTEVTLAFDPICNKFTNDEQKRGIQIGLEKLNAKEEKGYSGMSLITNIYLIGNILQQTEHQPFLEFIDSRNDMRSFLNGNLNSLQYINDGNTIKDYALSYLNQD